MQTKFRVRLSPSGDYFIETTQVYNDDLQRVLGNYWERASYTTFNTQQAAIEHMNHLVEQHKENVARLKEYSRLQAAGLDIIKEVTV